MKAVSLIRKQGLKQRMEEPEVFISRVNKLCIQMTHAWNHVDGQKQRKRTLRKMDRVVGTVRRHAQQYRDLLDKQWEQTQWTRPQAEQVLRRMDQVLQQLPEARRQARERILAGRQVENADKILSLYEPDAHVIVRKKARSEEHTSELQSLTNLVCRLLLEKKKAKTARLSRFRLTSPAPRLSALLSLYSTHVPPRQEAR